MSWHRDPKLVEGMQYQSQHRINLRLPRVAKKTRSHQGSVIAGGAVEALGNSICHNRENLRG